MVTSGSERRSPGDPRFADHDPVDFARTVSAVRNRLFGMTRTVPRFGRYEVTGTAGVGAMGRVYEARDPKLDRRVAIKVVRGDGSVPAADAYRRLRREAEALAQIHHPNIVEVYSVDRTDDDSLFIAMEYVDGQSWRKQMAAGPHHWRTVLGIAIDCGHALAAAHAGGLVHRDFKPDNVLIAHDGRVKVVDFGLAHQEVTDASPPDASAHALARAGTPAYAAPEVLEGDLVTAAADQYSFCVTVHEALFGVRPGREPSRSVRVPRTITKLLQTGLSKRPHDRHASMPALVAALERARRRRPWVTAAFVGAGLGGLVASVWTPTESEATRCPAQQQAQRSWGDSQRNDVQAAFDALGPPWSDTASAAVTARIDDYVTVWIAERQALCEASADDELDLRALCLRRARVQLEALVSVLREADRQVATRSIRAVADLPPPAECASIDDSNVFAGAPSQLHEDIEAILEDLARVRAVEAAGRWPQARAEAQALLDRARALDHAPLLAEVGFAAATLQWHMGDHDAAAKSFEAAFFAARGSGTTGVALDAGASLVKLHAMRGDYEASRRWLEHARASLVASGSPSLQRAELVLAEGTAISQRSRDGSSIPAFEQALELAQSEGGVPDVTFARIHDALAEANADAGRFGRARFHAETALEILEREQGEHHPDTGVALYQLARITSESGDNDRSAEMLRRLIALWETTLGPEHPNVGGAINGLANTLSNGGHLDEAEVEFRRALSLVIRTEGESSPGAALMHDNLATVLLRQGKNEEALSSARTGLEIRQRTLKPDHALIGNSHTHIGSALARLGQPREALEEHRVALAIHEAKLGPGHPTTAGTRMNVAVALEALGRVDDATELQRRVVGAYDTALGTSHPKVGSALMVLARLQHRRGNDALARQHLQRALEVHLGAPTVVAADVARVRFELARVSWASGEHDAALEAATAARDSVDTGPLRAEIDTWLGMDDRGRADF